MAPPSSPSGNRPVGGPERTDGLADETRPDRATSATEVPLPANDGATGFTAEPSDAVRLRRMVAARRAVDDDFYPFRFAPLSGRYPEPRIPFRQDPIPLVTSLYRRTGHENRTFVRWAPAEVFKTFVAQQELEGDLVWAVQLERMGIPAPGIDYVAGRLIPTLTSGAEGLAYLGYRMKNAFSPYEGWEVIDLRPGAPTPDLAALFGNRLQKVYSNLLAIHATLAANGVWHMDGVQFAANKNTGEVVLLDYGSFDIFDGPLFRAHLNDGFVRKTAADFRIDDLPANAVHLKKFLKDVGAQVAVLRREEISRYPEPQRTLLTVADEFLAELEGEGGGAFFFSLAGRWVAEGRSSFLRSFIYQSIDRELAARMTRRDYPTWGEEVRTQIRGMMEEPGPMNWIAERIAGWVERYEPLLKEELVIAETVFTEEDALGWRFREGVDPVLVNKIIGAETTDDVFIVVHPLPDDSRRESAVQFNRDLSAVMAAAQRAGVPSLLVQTQMLRSVILSRQAVAVTDENNGRIEGRFDSDRVTLAGGELTGCLNVAMRSLAQAAVTRGRKRLKIRLVAEGVYHLTDGEDRDPTTSLARTLAGLPANKRTPYLKNVLSTGFRFPSLYGNLPEGTTVVLSGDGEDHVIKRGTGEFTLTLEVVSAAGLFGGPEGKSEAGGGGGEAPVGTESHAPSSSVESVSAFAENLRRALVVETQRRGLTGLTTEVALIDEKRLLVLAKRTNRWLEILRRLGYGELAKLLSTAGEVSQTDRLLMMIAAVSGHRKMVTQLVARSLEIETGVGLPLLPAGIPVPALAAPGGIPVLMGR